MSSAKSVRAADERAASELLCLSSSVWARTRFCSTRPAVPCMRRWRRRQPTAQRRHGRCSLSEASAWGGREYFLWGADGSHLDLSLDRGGGAGRPRTLR